MFSIIAMEFFKLEPQQNGYLMAYFGIVQMVRQKSSLIVLSAVEVQVAGARVDTGD